MPQPHHPELADRPEFDPLLAFNAEPGVPQPAETPPDPAPAVSPPPAEDVAVLRLRLEHAEQSLDRALAEIAGMKSAVETLVTSVDDIKERLGHKSDPAPVAASPLPRQSVAPRTVAVVMLFATVATAAWGAWSIGDQVRREWRAGSEATPVARATASTAPLPTADPPAPVVNSPEPAPSRIVPAAASVTESSTPARAPAARPPTPSGVYVGTLSIDSSPAGQVFIDRKPAGRTPLRAEKLRAGSHLIWIERDGYRRWTRVVTVAANRVSRVSAGLDPLPR